MKELLQIFNSTISIFAWRAAQCSIVTNAINMIFFTEKQWFFNNPANTLEFSALRALENESIVNIAELIKKDPIVNELKIDIKRKADLIGHRNIISHPFIVKWRDEVTQKIFDENKHHTELKIALIYDIQSSINQELVKLNLEATNLDFPISIEMVQVFNSILNFSLKPEYLHDTKDNEYVVQTLNIFKGKLLDFVISKSKNE
ncbi:hypothetical protein AB3N60_11170 [Leptospira sp. WS39.C2]